MKSALTLLCILALTAIAPAAQRPNILIVLTDDMGFSDLGCFGGEIETPHLDALAAHGLRFTDFHNTARCWPTRSTLMSGVYSRGLSEQQVTIAEVLKTAGYQTGMVGKWHLGGNPAKDGPIQRGFDRFYGTMGGGGSYWNPPGLTRNTEFIKPEGEDYYYTDRIGMEAVRQIEAFANGDEPFFHNGTQAVIRGDWKGVRERKGPWHLYNLMENRTETENLAEAHPDRLREMIALYDAWETQSRTRPQPMQ